MVTRESAGEQTAAHDFEVCCLLSPDLARRRMGRREVLDNGSSARKSRCDRSAGRLGHLQRTLARSGAIAVCRPLAKDPDHERQRARTVVEQRAAQPVLLRTLVGGTAKRRRAGKQYRVTDEARREHLGRSRTCQRLRAATRAAFDFDRNVRISLPPRIVGVLSSFSKYRYSDRVEQCGAGF
jgi:hypothetical protein